VRSLTSNNTVSSAPISYRDLEELTKTCHENRMAEIFTFFRKAGYDPQALISLFGRTIKPDPTPPETALALLDSGRARFQAVCDKNNIEIPAIGFREAAVVIAGTVPKMELRDFLQRLQIAKPNHSGWTPWVDLSQAPNPSIRPYIIDGGWEAILDAMRDQWAGPHLDFWTMHPKGEFYCLRGLEDDMAHPRVHNPPKPRTQIDFLLQVSRVAEIISVGLSFARSMGCDEKETSLAFAFRWSALERRLLTSWVTPTRFVVPKGPSHQDELVSKTLIPLDTPQPAIPSYVELIVSPLFEIFGGAKFSSSIIAEIATETLQTRF